ncbi:hypothetical protein GGR28_003320 [Lewinella aquimaris]|uniref:DUF3891 family protein n=1 Tax=Neolewinella aquimaris TaxID=1835722 RepID=A0A840EAW2_9BACT|nr:DUF3891 family protein [Neolewinella aquimaris]MBB4080685.1 hypothetical protein [Neolewinella aquimaris]
MLVRPHPTGWRITLHPAHGLLAAELYTHLPSTVPPELALPTVLAVAQHDDHQLDFAAGDYLTERGAPKDFTLLKLSEAQRSEQAEGLMKDAYRKHGWTGLLIGRHFEFLYSGQPVDARLKKLLRQISTKRTEILHSRAWAADLLETTYGKLRFCDRLSLILCGEEAPSPGRELEINDAMGESIFLRQEDESRKVVVRPWPFEEASFSVSVESFVLDQLSFKSGEELGKKLADTPAEVRSWNLCEQ